MKKFKLVMLYLRNDVHGSSGSFGSRVRSECIVHNKYTARIRNLSYKPTPKHRAASKSELNLSYSRNHFSWLSQAVSKELINFLSQKVTHSSTFIDPVIN